MNLRTLPAFPRSLISIDGTVNKFIEAYTLELVESICLQQQPQCLLTDHLWLELVAPSELVARQVLL